MITKTTERFPSDIPALTSLRFVAAMMTVLFHVQNFSAKSYFLIFDNIMMRGYLAVDFFFMLSGFILTHSYIEAIRAGEFSYKNFLIRRLARIYPVHLFTLVVSIIMIAYAASLGTAQKHDAFSPLELASNIFLVQAWGLHEYMTYNIVAWSVSGEFFAYLFFPFLVSLTLMIKQQEKILPCTLVFFLMFYFSLYYFFSLYLTQLNTMGAIRIIPTFLIGIGLYLFTEKYSLRLRSDFVLLSLGVIIGILFELSFADYWIVPIFALVIWVAAEQSRQDYSGVLSKKTMIYLGQASYSLYMVQYCVWYILFSFILRTYNFMGMPAQLTWLLSISVVFIASLLTYHFIEVPSHRYINNKYAKTRKGGKS